MTDEKKKSKLPDFDEVTGIIGKLFNDLKTSVGEIVDDYKEKRSQPAGSDSQKSAGDKQRGKPGSEQSNKPGDKPASRPTDNPSKPSTPGAKVSDNKSPGDQPPGEK